MKFRGVHPQNFVEKQTVGMVIFAHSHSPDLRVNSCQGLRQVMPQVKSRVGHFFYRESSGLTELSSQEDVRMGDPH